MWILNLTLLAVLSLSAVGCTTYQVTRFEVEPPLRLPPVSTSADAIPIIDSPGSREYVEVGKVHAHGRCNWVYGFAGCREKRFAKLLQEGAASLSAEALVDVKRDSWNRWGWLERHYRATAIRWSKR